MRRRLITLWRIMTAGTRNFFRNAWLSIAATAVMVVTLTVMLSAIIFNSALNDALVDVTKKIDITIFFNAGTEQEQIDSLDSQLKQVENVESTHYVSKLEALARYREQNQDNPELLEAVNETENPLDESIEIQVENLNNIEPIIAVTEQEEFQPIVKETNYEGERQKTINRIGSFKNILTRAGAVGALIFAVIAILIIFNTIRIAIFSRKDEISIMRLVGATNGFIRGPFIFEGMLDGLVAAVITLFISFALVFYGGPKLLDFANVAPTLLFFQNHWTLVGLGTIAAGMLVGVISSSLAMARYLKL